MAGGCGQFSGSSHYRGGALGDDEESGNITQSGTYRGLGGATPSMGLSQVRGGGGMVGGCGEWTRPTGGSKPVPASALQEVKVGGKGRSARAAVVKKVMADKGLSMIEASKYVKAHKLY
jgi:hypothetical protein